MLIRLTTALESRGYAAYSKFDGNLGKESNKNR